MTWETLQPQEREAWLAEKIGWHIGGAGLVEAGLIPPQAWVDAYGEFKAWIKDWHPCTDPAAALGLLEEMRQRNYFIRIVLRAANHKAEHKYYCYIEPETINEWVRGCTVNADTLPAAICECVFRALADCPAAEQGVEMSSNEAKEFSAKLVAANEELSAIDTAMDEVDLPTRQDDWALTRVGRLLSLQDWWKDYAECTQKAVERAEAAERERDEARDALKSLALELAADHGAVLKAFIDERDAAQAEVQTLELVIAHVQRSLVKAMPKRALIQHLDDPERLSYYVDKLVEMKDADLAVNAALLAKQTDLAREAEIQAAGMRQALAFYADKASWDKDNWFNDWPAVIDRGSKARAALATPSTAGESLRPTMAEAVAAVRQAEQNIRARLDALPSTAGERIETDIFEHVRRGMGCVGIPQAQLEAMERVCEAGRQYRKVFWDWEEGSRWYNEMMRALDALAALEKGE